MATCVQPSVASIDSLLDTISRSAHTLKFDHKKDGLGGAFLNETNSQSSDGTRTPDDGSVSSTEIEIDGGIDVKPVDDLATAKARLLNACRTLMMMASEPTEVLKNMALIDKHNLISLQVINHYQMASLVPVTGEMSMTDLASKCRLPSDILIRIVRQAMTYHVFYEPRSGYIAHTAMSREIPRLAPLLSYQLEICLPSSLSLLSWLKQDSDNVRDEESHYKAPFQIAHKTHDSWWSYAEKRPSLIQNYGRYMALITKGGPHDVGHVVTGFDWRRLGRALVIDIGGADGYVGITLAEANPLLTVIVQDNPGLKESADAKIPTSLKGRVVFASHSFFEPQEAIGSYADVFLLRHILHDWDDAACIRILRHLTGCMKPNARIIVAEQVLSQPGTVDGGTEKVMRALDMQMMVQFGGKERTLSDWQNLFLRADPRLKLQGCIKPQGSADSLMDLQFACTEN